jgi:DNA-binding CsgD family transcriptional regulator
MSSELHTSCASSNGRAFHLWGRVHATVPAPTAPENSESDPGVSSLARVLFRVFDALGCGAIVLNGAKHPLHANERARKFLGDGLSTRSGHLCATDRTSDAVFQATMNQTLTPEGSQAGTEPVALKRRNGRPIIARALSVDGEPHAQADRPALVILLIDPDDRLKPSTALLKHVFGLTNAEARIASDLLDGRTVQEAAEQNDVSVGTIRCQTKAILAKTQTKRQADLVGLLTRLAVIAGEPGN